MINETPFQIKISKEQAKKLTKDLENVNDLKSAIHFVKNYKKYIIVNKKFKRKVVNFSIKSVASLSAIVMAMSLIKIKNNNDNNKEEFIITPVETTITNETTTPTKEEIITEPTIPSKTLETKENNNIIEEIVDLPIQEEFIIEDDASYEFNSPKMTIEFPKASNTNEESDYENYYKVKEKYGTYINEIANESGVDARLIIAMIAQENPDNIDETSVGTYGPMCVTSVHNRETYNYYHYEDGEYINEKVTVDIDNLKNDELYKNGEYGNITSGDAWCIYYGTIILKDCFYQVNKTNDLTLEENVPLAIAAYNHGYPDVIRNTKYSSSLFDACYSIRHDHAGDVNYDDDQYIEHVLNKIPDEELDKPFIFTDNNGNEICFNLERNNDLATIASEEIDNIKTI